MPDPTVTDDEGTVSEDGLFTNPIFAIPADVGDIAYCRVIPPDGYEWVSGALTIPSIEHVSLSANGIGWSADNTSLTFNEVINYPSGRLVFFRINSASNPAPSFVLPSDGLTVAVGNAAAGSFTAATSIVANVTAWQSVSGAVAALAAASCNVQVTGQKTAEGFVAAVTAIVANPSIYQFDPPTLSSRTAGNGSFTVTVDSVTNAAQYDIRYKKFNGIDTWHEVLNVGTGTEQVVNLTNGQEYQIQARCWNSGTAGYWGIGEYPGNPNSYYTLTPLTASAAGSVAAATAVTGAATLIPLPAAGSVAASTAVTGAATIAVSLTTYTETRYLHNDTDATLTTYYELLTSADSNGTVSYNDANMAFPGEILDEYESANEAVKAKLYKRTSGGTMTLLASNYVKQVAAEGTEITLPLVVSETSMNSTDRIVLGLEPGWWGLTMADATPAYVFDIGATTYFTTGELGANHIDAGTITLYLYGTNVTNLSRVGSSANYNARLSNFVWSG